MFEFLFYLVLTAIMFVVSELIRPKPKIENARPAHLGDFNFPTATEGRVVPQIWGTVKLEGPNVVWYGDLDNKPIKKKVKTGLFSSKKVVQGYRYNVGIQFALCRGEVDYLKKIWIGDRVVFEGALGESFTQITNLGLFGGDGLGNGGIDIPFRFYIGNRTQTPNSYLNQTPPDFLWYDDFESQGTDGEDVHEYQGTDPGSYYFVSQKGQVGNPTGGNTASVDNNLQTFTSTIAHPASSDVKVRSLFEGGAPGNLDRYIGLLLHPDRPRLNDNISIKMTFVPKAAGALDFTQHYLWMTCKCEDLNNHNSDYGVWVQVDDSTLIVGYESPTSGGVQQLISLAAPGDFTTLTGRHECELRVVGSKVSLYLDGVFMADHTEAKILDIPSDFQGFAMGVDGNANIEFFSANDWSAVGIYNFGIDSLLRSHIANVPAYRGLSYGVCEHGYVGNSSQIDPWKFEVRRVDAINFLELEDGKHEINGSDANPMNMLYEILTDVDWGLGQNPADIDTDNLIEVAETLYDEGNGISMTIDNALECNELIREIERQIDGNVFIDRSTGKWKVSLARGGYEVGDLPFIDETNTIRVEEFTRGAWEETTNNVRVEFANRANEYGITYTLGQDSANIRIQGGMMVSVTSNYPGVKDHDLATQIAWRDIRVLAYPLAKGTIVVDRSFHNINPGDVIAVSIANQQVVDLPMRVTRADLGQLDSGEIKLNLIQDVFGYDIPSFASPTNTQWLIPTGVAPENIPTGDRLIFEAPRKFDLLAEENTGEFYRIWVGGRNPGDGSSRFDIWGREGSDAYSLAGESEGYLVEGMVETAVDSVDPTPGNDTITIEADGDTMAVILEALEAHSLKDIGEGLFNLVMVGDELFAYQTFSTGVNTIIFEGVYRGMLDTVPAVHTTGVKVWVLSGNLTDLSWTPGSTVSIKPLPQNQAGSLDITVASASTVTMDDRHLKPYPPNNFTINSTPWDAGTVDFDDAFGAGLDGKGLTVEYTRRDFRNTNEVKAIDDEASLPADFPSANSTVYALEIRNDPAGTNTLLETTAHNGGTNSWNIERARILRFTAGVVPSRLRVSVLTKHTVDAIDYDANQNLTWDFDVASSDLAGDTNWGVLPFNTAAGVNHVAATTATYTLTIGAVMAGDVQVSINGGAYSTVITAGLTSGTFAVTATDTIKVKHQTNSSTGNQTLCQLTNGTAVSVAYAILTY